MQRHATKLILKLPFHCDVTYKTCLQLRNLLPISYWHEFLDIAFFYKAVHNLVFIDKEAPPATRRSMRSTKSSSSNAITYIPKRSRIVILINAHFSYMRTAHGMFYLLSFAQVTSLQPHLSSYHFNITIRFWTCTMLMTSEPGEQSFPDATKRRLSRAHRLAASSNFELLSCFLLIFLFIYQQLQLLSFFFLNRFFLLTRDPL